MEKHEQIEMLTELAQVAIDAVKSYNRALDEISDTVILTRLQEFRDAHQQHITQLSETIVALGGQAPDISEDFKGYVIEAFTALRKVTGMKGALKALKITEEIVNRHYRVSLPKEEPSVVKDLLRKHLSNTRNHIEYIDNNLHALEF